MNERIRVINLTRKLMLAMNVGVYFPLVQYRLNNLSDEQIRKIYQIIKEETKTWA